LTPFDPQRLAKLFESVRALAPSERRPHLERECPDDPILRDQVLNQVLEDERTSRDRSLASWSRTTHRGARTPVSSAESPSPARSVHSETRSTKVKLVLGSGPSPTVDFESLLSERMRKGVLIIFVAFTITFVSDIWSEKYPAGLMDPILLAHLVVVVASALSALVLWRMKRPTLRVLRSIEWIHLLAGVSFFALYEVGEFRSWEWWPPAFEQYRFEVIDVTGESCMLRWCALIVFYGLFVPNTWRRGVRVVCLIALCPLAVAVGVAIWDGRLAQYGPALIDMVIWLGIALTIAISGSNKIAHLSEQAKEARELGQYSLKQSLGSGGMGEVYLAQHPLLRRPCAIKVIRPEQALDRITQHQFDEEVQVAAELNHPNIIRVFDYGITEDERLYFTMEYLPGLTLQELVKKHAPLPPERVIHFLRQVCFALREIHGKGLIHRDIKPGNLIACQLGGIPDFVKLLDFGLVQTVSVSQGDSAHPTPPHGFVAGTPAYMSPEQASGSRDLDPRTDLYSLGSVGYYLLTGRPPFGNLPPLQCLDAHQRQPVPSLRSFRNDVPDDLEAVILRCLEKPPEKRFPDAIALEQALSACHCTSNWTESKAACWWQEHPVEERAVT
jgi:eukaryotic-like serine/threonine-protein kinase